MIEEVPVSADSTARAVLPAIVVHREKWVRPDRSAIPVAGENLDRAEPSAKKVSLGPSDLSATPESAENEVTVVRRAQTDHAAERDSAALKESPESRDLSAICQAFPSVRWKPLSHRRRARWSLR